MVFMSVSVSVKIFCERLRNLLSSCTWLKWLLMSVRPCRGSGIRPVWFFVHWLFGTTAIVLAWFNIFKGLDVYVGNWPDGGERKVSFEFFSTSVATLFVTGVVPEVPSTFQLSKPTCQRLIQILILLWMAGIVCSVGHQRCGPGLSVPLLGQAAIYKSTVNGSRSCQSAQGHCHDCCRRDPLSQARRRGTYSTGAGVIHDDPIEVHQQDVHSDLLWM